MAKFLPLTLNGIQNALPIIEKRLPRSVIVYNVAKLLLNGRYSENCVTQIFQLQLLPVDGVLNRNMEEKNQEQIFVSLQQRKFYNDSSVSICGPNSPAEIPVEAVNALDSLLDWSKAILFAANDTLLTDALIAKVYSRHTDSPLEVDCCYLYYLPTEEAKNLCIAGEEDKLLKIKPLETSDAEKVATAWKFSSQGTVDTFQDTIKTIGSAGVYVQEELASWIIFSPVGAMVSLGTDPAYRRKGYATMAMNACAKFSALNYQLIPNVQIQLENSTSKSLVDKSLFRFSHMVDWIHFRPKK